VRSVVVFMGHWQGAATDGLVEITRPVLGAEKSDGRIFDRTTGACCWGHPRVRHAFSVRLCVWDVSPGAAAPGYGETTPLAWKTLFIGSNFKCHNLLNLFEWIRHCVGH
jgi:hypothetical protein